VFSERKCIEGAVATNDFLLKLVELVITKSKKYAVLLGSGASSVVIGLALNKFNNGKLASIEHDVEFAHKARKFIKIYKLDKAVDVKFRKLMDYHCHD